MNRRSNERAPSPSHRFVLASLVAVAVVHALTYAHATSDDAYISLRYAAHLAEGHGPVYNPGQTPVEGYSNPLFVAVAACLLWLGLPALWVIKGVGLASFATAMALLPRLVRALAPDLPAQAGAMAAAILATSAFPALWAIGGLETMLHAAIVLAATTTAIEEARRGEVRRSPAAFVLVAAGRPEGALLAAAAAAAQWLALRCDRRTVVAWTLRFGLPCMVLLCARRLYYEAWLPNTAVAKAYFGADSAAAGARYLIAFVTGGGHLVTAAAVVGCAHALRRSPQGHFALIAIAIVVAQAAFALGVGGDFMPGFRFTVPAYPVLCALAGVGLFAASERVAMRSSGRLAVAVALLLCAVTTFAQSRALASHSHRFWFAHERPWYASFGRTDLAGTWLEGHEAAGRYIAERAKPDDLLAVTEAGVMPFMAGTTTIDLLGLNHREIAKMWRQAAEEERWRREQEAAHEESLPLSRNWAYDIAGHALAQRPRWVILDGRYAVDGKAFLPRLAIGHWLQRRAEWADYRAVFEAKVYDGERVGLGPDRINVVFERR